MPPERSTNYFGAEGLRYLRGMRNRLAHNYLGIDEGVLWDAIGADLPAVFERMYDDVEQARLVLGDANAQLVDPNTWAETHLRSLEDDGRPGAT